MGKKTYVLTNLLADDGYVVFLQRRMEVMVEDIPATHKSTS